MNNITKLEVDIYNEAIKHYIQSTHWLSDCTKITVIIISL